MRPGADTLLSPTAMTPCGPGGTAVRGPPTQTMTRNTAVIYLLNKAIYLSIDKYLFSIKLKHIITITASFIILLGYILPRGAEMDKDEWI